ncbi:hypothetical protein GGX14DRAFT_576364 [Mycena pura]|uniref:Uncharacterized protein n=1 Tax=Mycena pura TaxID=153505 RepID=A0AAD6Y1A7_9AGAR|nr:hypothetical protein GGX14DRAFT_576364 [Mycena pura]
MSAHTAPSLPTPQLVCDVQITSKTTLEKLYTWPAGTVLEYPETSATGSIGHLFPISTFTLTRNMMYSTGDPKGGPGKKHPVFVDILLDDNGQKVPCKLSFKTCIRACPYADLEDLRAPHTTASREEIARRLALEQKQQDDHLSTNAILFRKTLSYFVALQRQGCGGPPHEETVYSASELDEWDEWIAQQEQIRRGHSPRPTCNGRLFFRYDGQGRAFVVCEHRNRKGNLDHLIDFTAGSGLYNTEYLEALFFNDTDMIAEFEEQGLAVANTGPSSICTTVANCSTIKVDCVNEHRDADGKIVLAALTRLICKCKFLLYEPHPEYAKQCPWVLLVCHGDHPHPIPLPTKTPPHIRYMLFDLLERLDHDLADLTPRRFLRHPATTSFLRQLLPHDDSPTLLDLHTSLGNCDHLRSYIVQVQRRMFPSGTGWDGLLHLKQQQDVELLPEDAYIRCVEEFPALGLDTYDDDDDDDGDELASTSSFRIAICMTRESSHLLLKAKFLQSDISFRRIAGFKEFELGGLDASSRTSAAYCRIYVNRQTAAAHQIIFQKIHDIVLNDTGENLRWRHLHARSRTEEVGVLHFVMDQHGGQAKGLGLYLKAYAQRLPGKMDLHEERPLSSLDEYDHLARVARLCTAHIYRNIRKANVPEGVRNLMRSLVCMQHDSWDETIERIVAEGGRPAANWVADKIRSKFAFPAMCWEKSFIPKSIWQVGDNTSNIIESLHADANREGVSCTLVGGVKKGLNFDSLKLKTLGNLGVLGIRPGYARGHISETTKKSLKRKATVQHKVLSKQDIRIQNQNKRMRTVYDAKIQAEQKLQTLQSGAGSQTALERALHAHDRTREAFEKVVAASHELVGSGSGKVGLLLPSGQGQSSLA